MAWHQWQLCHRLQWLWKPFLSPVDGLKVTQGMSPEACAGSACQGPSHGPLRQHGHSARWRCPTCTGTASFRRSSWPNLGTFILNRHSLEADGKETFLLFRESHWEGPFPFPGNVLVREEPVSAWTCWQPSMAVTWGRFAMKWSPQKAECRQRKKTVFGDTFECSIEF